MAEVHRHGKNWYIGRNPKNVVRKQPYTGTFQQTVAPTRRLYRGGFWTGQDWANNYSMAMSFETREEAEAYVCANF